MGVRIAPASLARVDKEIVMLRLRCRKCQTEWEAARDSRRFENGHQDCPKCDVKPERRRPKVDRMRSAVTQVWDTHRRVRGEVIWTNRVAATVAKPKLVKAPDLTANSLH